MHFLTHYYIPALRVSKLVLAVVDVRERPNSMKLYSSHCDSVGTEFLGFSTTGRATVTHKNWHSPHAPSKELVYCIQCCLQLTLQNNTMINDCATFS